LGKARRSSQGFGDKEEDWAGSIHRILVCLLIAWRGYILVQGGVEKEAGILTQENSYDWIVFLPISDGTKQMKNS
jgi:hypothetical protein